MKVLDATYLIDYLAGAPSTAEYYQENGGDDERWIIPVPALAETLVGVGNLPSGDVDSAIVSLRWGEPYRVDESLSFEAARIADEIGPQGPYLDGVDALVAAVGRELDSPVVTDDSDLTHTATRHVVTVEEYR